MTHQEEVDLRDAMLDFQEVLPKLEFRKREIIKLYYLEGYSLRDIGRLFHRGAEQMRQVKLRALAELRTLLHY